MVNLDTEDQNRPAAWGVVGCTEQTGDVLRYGRVSLMKKRKEEEEAEIESVLT
jgi:hypothetical protein